MAEIGLSLLLLIAAGLLLKDFAALRNANVGVRTDHVWTGAVRLPDASYKETQKQYDFAQTLLARVQQIPGVESAALSTRLPTEGGSNYYAKIRGKVSEAMSGPAGRNFTAFLRTTTIPIPRSPTRSYFRR